MFKAKQRKSLRKRSRHTQLRGLWQRGKWWFTGGADTGAIALLVVLTSTLSGPQAATGGELAPDMVLATTDGEFQLSEQRGQVSLLYFSFPG